MEIVVHDNTLKTVAVINNDIPMLPSFFNDNWHRYKDQGAETFIFTVNKFINGQLQDYCRFLNEQAYISFTYDGIDHLFGVENVQESDYQITLTCSSLNLELRNEQANALVNTSSHNIQWYIDQMELISNAQITIGTNEVSSLARTINYDGQESKLARLISVIGNFDAEFEFITHLNDDGTLDSIILNIYRANDGVNIQGVGTNRNDVSLNFGKNISGITRTGDTTNLFNATKITGSDDLNWNSSEFSYVNSDGVEEFYKRKNDDTAFAPLSLNLFKSQIKTNNGDKWIRKDFQTEYTNVNDMWGYCVSQFKQFAYPTVTYEVLANSSLVLESVGNDRPLSIGDTINIQDDNFMDSDGNVGLLLSARVSEMEISFSNPTLNKITFSNFKKQQSEASADIQAIVNQLVEAATPFRAELSTTNGTQFKNGTGSTTLSAHIFKGSATTETVADSYEWSKDGTVVAPTQSITVDASGVTDKAVYSFKATVAGKVVAGQSVTITNVNDGAKGAQGPQGPQGPQGLKGDPGATGIPGQAGADGKTSYLHIAYATNSTGTDGFDVSNATGKTYIGQYTDFTSADSTDPSKYIWSLIKGDKGDKGDTGPQGPQGERGIAGATGAIGSPGPKGADGRSSYIHIKYAPVINPTDSQITDTPNAYIGVYTDYNQADSTSASAYTWSKWQGEDGANGVAGAKGADGRTTYVHFAYANSTNGQTNFSTSYFDGALYMGTLTDYTQTDSTNYAAYTWSRLKGDKGDKGDQGIQGLQGPAGTQGVAGPKGADGKTQYTHIAYANSSDGVTNFSTSDSNRTYIGMYVDFIINDSTKPSDYSWTLVKGADGTQGTPGKPGTDGKTPYFHTAWSYSADGTDGFSTVYPNLNLGDNTKTFVGTEVEGSNLKGSIRIDPATQKTQDGDFYYLTFKSTKDNYDWFRFFLIPVTTTPNMTKVPVKPNTKYTFSVYLKGNGTHTIYAWRHWAAPNTPWFFQVNLTNEWKLYTFTVTSRDVIPSEDVQFFIRSNNATEINLKKPKVEPGSTATPHMPSASEVTTADWPSYIGQYTDFTQADSTNPSDYTWSLIRGNDGKDGADGKDGIAGKDGVGIKTTVITYAISTSGTTAPTTGWTSSVPSLVKGQYLWTKTVWTYTDNSSETGYSVTYISKDGNNGNDGIAGKDGVGILTTTITYAGSTSGTTVPTSGWTSTIPTVAAGSYLWTKTVWTYTDNTSETGYSVAMMGVKGERGKQIFKSSYESVPHNTGHYWSDLSPAPSIDNPPKIGDTVITPSGNILQIDTVNVGGGGGGGTFGVGDVLGNIKGPSGSNGDPGKIVSDTEPTTRFKGLTWKYSGTADLTASDGTVINPNTEYFYNGTHWVINYFSVNNFAAESITSDKIDGKNLTITDGEFISKTTNGPVTTSTEIKDNHIAISKTDGTVNTRNDIALDSEQGLAQKFTNINTGFYRTAGINYQGPFTSDSDGNYAQLTPQGTKLSTDVPWTKLSLMNNFNGNIEYAIINGTVYISASGVGVPAMTAGQWKQAAQLPTGSSAIPIRANRIAAGDSGDGLSWALLSNQAGGIFIRCSANKAPTPNLFNATLPYPIG